MNIFSNIQNWVEYWRKLTRHWNTQMHVKVYTVHCCIPYKCNTSLNPYLFVIVHRHYELSIPSSKRNEKIKLRIHCLWRLGTAFINVNKNGHFLICGSEHSARSKSFALYSKKCQSRPWCYAFKYVVIRIYVNINIQWDNSCKVVLSKGKILFKAVNWE